MKISQANLISLSLSINKMSVAIGHLVGDQDPYAGGLRTDAVYVARHPDAPRLHVETTGSIRYEDPRKAYPSSYESAARIGRLDRMITPDVFERLTYAGASGAPAQIADSAIAITEFSLNPIGQREASYNDDIQFFQHRFQFRNQQKSVQDPRRYMWENDSKPQGAPQCFLNYAYFPVTRRETGRDGVQAVKVSAMMVIYSSHPVPNMVAHATNYRRWKTPTTQWGGGSELWVDFALIGDDNAYRSIESAVNTMNPVSGSYITFAPCLAHNIARVAMETTAGELSNDASMFRRYFLINGSSLGLAVCAAIAGMPSILYSGFINTIEGPSTKLEGSIKTGHAVQVGPTTSIVESVTDLGYKCYYSMTNQEPLVIPFTSWNNQPIRSLLEKVGSASEANQLYLNMVDAMVTTDRLENGLSYMEKVSPLLCAKTLSEVNFLASLAFYAYHYAPRSDAKLNTEASPRAALARLNHAQPLLGRNVDRIAFMRSVAAKKVRKSKKGSKKAKKSKAAKGSAKPKKEKKAKATKKSSKKGGGKGKKSKAKPKAKGKGKKKSITFADAESWASRPRKGAGKGKGRRSAPPSYTATMRGGEDVPPAYQAQFPPMRGGGGGSNGGILGYGSLPSFTRSRRNSGTSTPAPRNPWQQTRQNGHNGALQSYNEAPAPDYEDFSDWDTYQQMQREDQDQTGQYERDWRQAQQQEDDDMDLAPAPPRPGTQDYYASVIDDMDEEDYQRDLQREAMGRDGIVVQRGPFGDTTGVRRHRNAGRLHGAKVSGRQKSRHQGKFSGRSQATVKSMRDSARQTLMNQKRGRVGYKASGLFTGIAADRPRWSTGLDSVRAMDGGYHADGLFDGIKSVGKKALSAWKTVRPFATPIIGRIGRYAVDRAADFARSKISDFENSQDD